MILQRQKGYREESPADVLLLSDIRRLSDVRFTFDILIE